jgi:HEAT repeat protein
VGEQADLPALPARERLPFLKLWVHLQGSLRGEARDALNAIARELGVEASARRLLDGGRRAERLLAALTLGHLRDAQAWPQLLRLSALSDRTLALTAIWAMVRIDAHAAAQHILPAYLAHEDWSLSHVAAMLQEAPVPAGAALAELLPSVPHAQLPRALRMAEALRMAVPVAVLRGALASSDVAVLVAALRSVTMQDTIDAVRGLLGHAHWQVRVQAARAMGRIGAPEDIGRLEPLLADREWWVRYRAAQAAVELANLYGMPLDQVRAHLSDRFAADMLSQVLAEKGLA